MGKIITYNTDGTLISSVDDGIAEPPNWNGLKQALWGNMTLLGKAVLSCNTKPANAVGIALLSDTMKDGHDGIGTQNGFLKAWALIDVAWSDDEKTIINGYLAANNFTIRI